MLRKLILSVLVLFVSVLKITAQEYPKFDSVLHFLGENYKIDNAEAYPNLVKNDEGYFLEFINYRTRQQDDILKIWDARTTQYQRLKLPRVFENTSSNHNKVQSKFSTVYGFKYDLFHHFGYIGWMKDEIKFLEKKETKMSDDDLYALARIYASEYGSFIHKNYEFSDTNQCVVKSETAKNQLNEVQLNQVLDLYNFSIQTYQKLIDKNPNYITQIMDIKNKKDCETMTLFTYLCWIQNEKEAYKVIENKMLFSDYYRALGRSLLDACEPNTILFTNGDLDTYIPIYLQAKENYRTDVSVLNINILNYTNFVNYLQSEKGSKYFTPVKMSLNENDYANDRIDYAYLEYVENDVTVKDLILQLKNDEFYNRDFTIKKIKTNSFYTSSFKVEIRNKNLVLGDMVKLDIIDNNLGKRPIYFVSNNPPFGNSANYEYLGNVIKINPQPNQNCESCEHEFINITQLEKYIYNAPIQPKLSTETNTNSYYQKAIVQYCNYYLKLNKHEPIKKMLNFYIDNYKSTPFNISYQQASMLRIADYLEDLKFYDKLENCFAQDWIQLKNNIEALRFYQDYFKAYQKRFLENNFRNAKNIQILKSVFE